MEEKTRAALERPGVKKILADFINLFHPQARLSLAEFRDRYGPLLISGEDKDPIQPIVDKMILNIACAFATALNAKMETERQAEDINKKLDEILGHAMYAAFLIPAGMSDTLLSVPSAIRADFLSGAWEPTHRTLLDALAIELVRSRKALHRCERPECGLYFVKTYTHDKYCSNLCSEKMRRRGQYRWVSANRQELNRRRRKSYSKAVHPRKRS